MEAKEYIKSIKGNFAIKDLKSVFDKFKNLNVLVIGDIIIDIYTFVHPKGRAIKDPILSTGFEKEEKYAGGILAICNHLSSYVHKIKLVTIIGDKPPFSEFVKKSLASNIELKTFLKKNSPTNIKKRYIDNYRNHKLFKVEYINDEPLEKGLSNQIKDYISKEAKNYDLVIVGDFGHGFLNDEIRKAIEKNAKFLCINVQSNSSNMGYNYVNHYRKPDYIIMNEEEMRLPLMKRFEELDDVIKTFWKKFKFKRFMVTTGKKGGVYCNNGSMHEAPAFAKNVVDTVGAGDAVFAVSTLLAYNNVTDEIFPFIANCAGAVKSEYIGNKESVSKEKLLNFIKELYENGME